MDDAFERRLTDRLRADAELGVRSFDSRAIVVVAMREGGSTRRFVWPRFDVPMLGRVSQTAVAMVAVAAVLVLVVAIVPQLSGPGPSRLPLPTVPGSPTPTGSSGPSAPASPTPAGSRVPSVPPPSVPVQTNSPGASPGISYSHWNEVPLLAPDDQTPGMAVRGVVEFQGQYIAVGSQQLSGEDARLLVWSSADGAEWQPVPVDLPFSALELWATASNDEQIVVTGYTAGPADARMTYSTLTSSDGETWTQHDAPDLFTTLTARDGLFVAAVPDASDATRPASVWTSPDGIDWTRAAGPEQFFDSSSEIRRLNRLHGIEVDGEPAVIAAGWNQAEAMMWLSADPDLSDWRKIDLAGPDGITLADVAAGPKGMLAIGTAGYCCRMRAWTSEDGAAWTQVPEPLDEAIFASRVVAVPEGFVVFGGRPLGEASSTPAAWFTPDGRTPWREIPLSGVVPEQPNVQNFDLTVRPDGSIIVAATQYSESGLPLTPLAWLVEP